MAEIQAFAEVFERIKRAYVEEVDDATLLRNAMRGMLSELDPHSTYLDAKAYESLRETTQASSAAWVSRWASATASSP